MTETHNAPLEAAFAAWAKLENGDANNPQYKADIMEMLQAAIAAYEAVKGEFMNDEMEAAFEKWWNPLDLPTTSHEAVVKAFCKNAWEASNRAIKQELMSGHTEADRKYHEDVLKCVGELKYIRGIVERGTGGVVDGNISTSSAILAYVKELEAKITKKAEI